MDDELIGHTMKILENFQDINFIIVADHGMADLYDNKSHIIYLEDYLTNGSFKLKSHKFIEPIANYTVGDLWKNLTKLNDSGIARIYM